MTKIAIYFLDEVEDIDVSPHEFRPIGYVRDRWELTEDYEEADWIYFYLDYLNCNEQFTRLQGDPVWRQYRDKAILYAMHDTPSFAYLQPHGVKFLAQPMVGKEENLTNQIVSMPLQMRGYEQELIKDEAFIRELREIPKKTDFCFIGQTAYMGRAKFHPENMRISLPEGATYSFRGTTPIWHVKDLQGRLELTKDFCREVAQAKFGFAPRGIGSSSFRLYQSLMSGTIPIIYGMTDFPFTEALDWSEFSVNGDKMNLKSLLDLDHEKMRKRAIEVWDEYFHMTKTDEYLFETYLEKQ